jgi:benzoate-CoA ligase family protein
MGMEYKYRSYEPELYNVTSRLIDDKIKDGWGDKTAVLYRDRIYTYREIQELVNRVGNVLKSSGVRIEQRVMIALYDSPEALACFLGAIKIGAVPIMVNYMYTADDYRLLLNDSRAVTLIIDHDFVETAEAWRSEFSYLKDTFVFGSPSRPFHLSFQDTLARASDELDAAGTSADDVAFWNYTSGSTGVPKAAVHLQHDIARCVESYAKGVLGITENDRLFSASKLFFAYGLGNSAYFPLAFGASVVLLPERPLPAVVFETIEKYRPTVFFGVPTLYAAMLQVEGAEKKYDLSSLRHCVSAGEALPVEIYHRWKDKFRIEILDGLGSTEMLHIFISNRPGDIKPGSSGRVLDGYVCRIVGENGQDLPDGEIGTLWVKGDSAAAYYYRHHEKTKKSMLGEWFDTGDKYSRDAAGNYYYQGRGDDMLKVGGIWVSPLEIEETIIRHPTVLEVAVVGKPDETGLIKPKAFIVLKPDCLPTPHLAAEIQAFVKKSIAAYKYPRWVEFIGELPRTATGKVQRHRLRDAY